MIGYVALHKRTRWHVAQAVQVNGYECILWPLCAQVKPGREQIREVWVDLVDLLIDGDEDTLCEHCMASIRAEDRAKGLV